MFLFLSMKRQCIKHLSPATENRTYVTFLRLGWNVEAVDGELIVTLRKDQIQPLLQFRRQSWDFNHLILANILEKIKAGDEKSTRNL